VIIGVNRVLEHDGREFHVQAEDLGIDQACFEVRVYEKGTVLWRKQVAYAEIVARDLPKLEREEALRTLMEKTVQTVHAAIAKGKIG
jgi:hypothetical protein